LSFVARVVPNPRRSLNAVRISLVKIVWCESGFAS